jgi:hypothetical protein
MKTLHSFILFLTLASGAFGQVSELSRATKGGVGSGGGGQDKHLECLNEVNRWIDQNKIPQLRIENLAPCGLSQDQNECVVFDFNNNIDHDFRASLVECRVIAD